MLNWDCVGQPMIMENWYIKPVCFIIFTRSCLHFHRFYSFHVMVKTIVTLSPLTNLSSLMSCCGVFREDLVDFCRNFRCKCAWWRRQSRLCFLLVILKPSTACNFLSSEDVGSAYVSINFFVRQASYSKHQTPHWVLELS